MKLKSDADIERVARIIEADVGHSIESIRDALKDVRDSNTSSIQSREKILVRTARAKTDLS